jgi:serine/threonine-protein kinase
MTEPHAPVVAYEFGAFRLEPARRSLTRNDGRPVEITSKAFDALVCLVEHAGTLVTRSELTQTLWPRTIVEDNSLNKLIAALRRALADDQGQHYVVTLQGRGYQFVADVRTAAVQRSSAAPEPELENRDRAAADMQPSARVGHYEVVSAAGRGDVRVDIEGALVASTAESSRRIRWQVQLAAMGLGGVVLGAVAAWVLADRLAAERTAEPVHASMSFAGTPVAMPFGSRHLAIADDGSRMAVLLQDRMWVRRPRDREAVVIDQIGMTNPFFSPDGAWIGFSNNGLLKVPSAGGTATRLTTTTARPAGASWGADGTIVYATTEGLYRIGENGGEAQLLAKPSRERKERLYAWPQFLPDGTAVLFTMLSQDESEPPQIFVVDLRSLESRRVLVGGAAARYVSTGHLVYADATALKAVEFDLERRATRGEAFAASNIAVATTADNAAAEFALSDTGTLLYLAPGHQTTADLRTLAWVDRRGVEEPLSQPPNYYQFPRVSPQGTHVALDMNIRGNRNVWTLDLDRGMLMPLTTQPTEDMMPVWSVDGRHLLFGSDRGGDFDVYSQPADGSSEAVAVSVSPGMQVPHSITPDGTRVAVYEDGNLSVLDLETSILQPLLHDGAEHGISEVSPDGHWIAYEAVDSTGQFEVFVRPFPEVEAGREKVSLNGGRFPRWGLPGSGELFYLTPKGELVVVTLELASGLRVSAPTKIFDLERPPPYRAPRPYDVAPDGRFLVTRPVVTAADQRTEVLVELNWFEDLFAR